jgi:putative redox protein
MRHDAGRVRVGADTFLSRERMRLIVRSRFALVFGKKTYRNGKDSIMSVEIDIHYQGDLHCEVTHGPSGSKLITDAPVDNGGKGEAFSPTDLVAVAFGTCIITIMDLAARKHGLNLTGTKIHVSKEMSATPPRRVAVLRATVTVPRGKSISETDRQKLEAAASKCPVKESLHPETKMEIQYVYTD